MRLSVTGCGYLGAVHAAAMASLGHEVVGIDVDEAKIAALSGGRAPFFEPGLDEMLAAELAAGRLTFSTDPASAAGAGGRDRGPVTGGVSSGKRRPDGR